jgi:FkbM family methyltransferase
MVRIPNSVLRVLRPMNYYRFLLWRVKIFQISFHSMIFNRRLSKSGQKGLFLDCGSNVGQGFEFFREYYPNKNYDYVLFEPNPYCFEELFKKYADLTDSGVQLENLAVGINNGHIDFYGLEEEKGGVYSVGGTVLPEHNSKMYGTPSSASLKVQSINFSEFLVNVLKKNVYAVVILKLDIEGGEYALLDALRSEGLLSIFETIYVEFHSQYMRTDIASYYIVKEKEFLKYAKKIGTRVVKWI